MHLDAVFYAWLLAFVLLCTVYGAATVILDLRQTVKRRDDDIKHWQNRTDQKSKLLDDERKAHRAKVDELIIKHRDERELLIGEKHDAKARLYDAQCAYRRATAAYQAHIRELGASLSRQEDRVATLHSELARWRCAALDILEPQRTGS